MPCLQKEEEIINFNYSNEEIDNYIVAINKIFKNMDYYKKNARNHILESFTIEKMVEKMDEILGNIIAKNSTKDENVSNYRDIFSELIVKYLMLHSKEYEWLCKNFNEELFGKDAFEEFNNLTEEHNKYRSKKQKIIELTVKLHIFKESKIIYNILKTILKAIKKVIKLSIELIKQIGKRIINFFRKKFREEKMKNNFFKRLYDYRELLKTNVKKDVRGKYKKSFFGFLWSFLNPLLQIAVYAIVFPLILKNTQSYYVIFICTGLIPWTFFSTTVSRSAGCMIENGNILKKVYFPREIIPISLVTAEAFNFVISTIIIIAFVLIYGLGITWYILFYPLVLLIQYLLLLAISFVISSVTVYFRDLQHFIGVGLQLLFYATPIVYSGNTIPENFRWIIKINPMSYIIDAYRDIFYNQQMPNLISLGKLAIILVVLCYVGYLIFNKLQKKFAEEL